MDGQVIPQPAQFAVADSGGMETETWDVCVQKTVIPGLGVTPERRGILLADGLGQHHKYRAIMMAKAGGLDLALRFPHGSRRNQKEDFENFSRFKPAHEQAKIQVQKIDWRCDDGGRSLTQRSSRRQERSLQPKSS
mmetsp:Transcript_17591/g.44160  ORF Transcript_17591/g.44160 Transcript_17591/m.44160 type:complete len:136 (-) Transcript_17591:266-673(-)